MKIPPSLPSLQGAAFLPFPTSSRPHVLQAAVSPASPASTLHFSPGSSLGSLESPSAWDRSLQLASPGSSPAEWVAAAVHQLRSASSPLTPVPARRPASPHARSRRVVEFTSPHWPWRPVQLTFALQPRLSSSRFSYLCSPDVCSSCSRADGIDRLRRIPDGAACHVWRDSLIYYHPGVSGSLSTPPSPAGGRRRVCAVFICRLGRVWRYHALSGGSRASPSALVRVVATRRASVYRR